MENKKVSEKKDSWLKVLLSYTEGSGQRLGISVSSNQIPFYYLFLLLFLPPLGRNCLSSLTEYISQIWRFPAHSCKI